MRPFVCFVVGFGALLYLIKMLFDRLEKRRARSSARSGRKV
jgi:hypothetical protein